MNDFEYDDDKSKANLKKYGIDFLDAQALLCRRHLQKRNNLDNFCEAFA